MLGNSELSVVLANLFINENSKVDFHTREADMNVMLWHNWYLLFKPTPEETVDEVCIGILLFVLWFCILTCCFLVYLLSTCLNTVVIHQYLHLLIPLVFFYKKRLYFDNNVVFLVTIDNGMNPPFLFQLEYSLCGNMEL